MKLLLKALKIPFPPPLLNLDYMKTAMFIPDNRFMQKQNMVCIYIEQISPFISFATIASSIVFVVITVL